MKSQQNINHNCYMTNEHRSLPRLTGGEHLLQLPGAVGLDDPGPHLQRSRCAAHVADELLDDLLGRSQHVETMYISLQVVTAPWLKSETVLLYHRYVNVCYVYIYVCIMSMSMPIYFHMIYRYVYINDYKCIYGNVMKYWHIHVHPQTCEQVFQDLFAVSLQRFFTGFWLPTLPLSQSISHNVRFAQPQSSGCPKTPGHSL